MLSFGVDSTGRRARRSRFCVGLLVLVLAGVGRWLHGYFPAQLTCVLA
jgi:hypothetical protein